MGDIVLLVRLTSFGPLICPECRTVLTSEEALGSHKRKTQHDAQRRWVCNRLSLREVSRYKRCAHPYLRNELLEPPPRAELRPTALRPTIWSPEIRMISILT
jgi:hypothetical protein